jgi:putative ABC transport system permease protein
MTTVYNKWSDFSWDGKDPASQIALEALMTEWDYEKAAGLKFIQGRPFSKEYTTDSNGVIINEAALKVIGYQDPIGKTMTSGGRVITIVGVIENVVMLDPFKPVEPGVILFNALKADNFNNILLRVKPKVDLKKALATIQPIFEKYNPSLPFEYRFVDEEFDKKFAMENQVGKLAGIFAGLTIFISCLGLFGLAMFMAERRTKEIGIRKVLGASVANLWMLLSKEFVWLILIACLIASPLSFWLMKGWLQKYDYRIDISWWVFAIAALLAVVIALVTVSTQAIKSAMANPVKSLRTE